MSDLIVKIDEVLCDSGESPLSAEPGDPLGALRVTGARMLDSACLNNVTVVRAGDKFYAGEFIYELREVTRAEAKEIADSFKDEE